MFDSVGEIWSFYGAQGYPSRYLFNGDFRLEDMQVGEGAYGDTEQLIRELTGSAVEPLGILRAEDGDDVPLVVPSEDRQGAGDSSYAAGAVWLSVAGGGVVTVNGESFEVAGPSAVEVVRHPRHTEGELVIEPGDGVTVLATCFAPGLAPTT